jgi:ABC-2 type transport system permease protein
VTTIALTRTAPSLRQSLARTVGVIAALARVAFAMAVAYRSQFIVWILATNTPLVMLALWSSVAEEAPFGNFGQRKFVAYFLVALVVRLLTGTWVVWEMNLEIKDGTLSQRLLRPVHPFLAYAVDNLAAVPLRGLVSIPVALVVVCTVARSELSRDPVLWLAAPCAVLGAWLISFAAMLAIGALGLFWESSIALWDLWFSFYFVFSGYLFPLALIPSWLGRWVAASPFPYTLAFPVETMLGMVSRADAFTGLAIQWSYGAGFLAVALWIWRRGLVRYAAYGG